MHTMAIVDVFKEGEVLEVALPRRGQMTYLGKGRVCLGGYRD